MTLLVATVNRQHVGVAADSNSYLDGQQTTPHANTKVATLAGRFVVSSMGSNTATLDPERFDFSGVARPGGRPSLRPGAKPGQERWDEWGRSPWSFRMRRFDGRASLSNASFDKAWEAYRDFMLADYEAELQVWPETWTHRAWEQWTLMAGFDELDDVAHLRRARYSWAPGDQRVGVEEAELYRVGAADEGNRWWVMGMEHDKALSWLNEQDLAGSTLDTTLRMLGGSMSHAIRHAQADEHGFAIGGLIRGAVASRDEAQIGYYEDSRWHLAAVPKSTIG